MKNILILLFVSLLILWSCEDDNPVNVKNEPVITNLSPSYGISNQLGSIVGKGFGNDKNAIKVFLGETECTFYEVKDSLINFKVPVKESGTYVVYILINEKKIVSPVDFRIIENEKPFVESYYPEYGFSNDTLTLIGKFFGNGIKNIKVVIGTKSCEIISTVDSMIIVKIPTMTEGQYPLKLEYNQYIQILNPNYWIDKPTLIFHDFYPKKCSPKDTVFIKIQNYKCSIGDIKVKIGEYASIVYFSDTLIKVIPSMYEEVGKYVLTIELGKDKLIKENDTIEIYRPFSELLSVTFALKNFIMEHYFSESYSSVNGSSGSSKTDTATRSKNYVYNIKSLSGYNMSNGQYLSFFYYFERINSVSMYVDTTKKTFMNCNYDFQKYSKYDQTRGEKEYTLTIIKIPEAKYAIDSVGNYFAKINSEIIKNINFEFEEYSKYERHSGHENDYKINTYKILGTTDSSEIIIKLNYK